MRGTDGHVGEALPPGASVSTVLLRLGCDPSGSFAAIIPLATARARSRRGNWQPTHDDTEDIAAEVCLRLPNDHHALLRRAEPEASFDAFLGGVVRNVALEHIREDARQHRTPQAIALHAGAIARRAEARRARASHYDRSHAGALTAKEAEALELHLTGVSTSEVSRRLGITRESARDRIAAAWKALERARRGDASPARAALPDLDRLPGRPLSRRQREICALWHGGQSRAAIARVLHATVPAVRAALQRVRRRGPARR